MTLAWFGSNSGMVLDCFGDDSGLIWACFGVDWGMLFWLPANNRAPTGQGQPGNRAERPTRISEKRSQPSIFGKWANRENGPTGRWANKKNLNPLSGHKLVQIVSHRRLNTILLIASRLFFLKGSQHSQIKEFIDFYWIDMTSLEFIVFLRIP